MHAVVRDIRERHRATVALTESEQRFQSAFDAPLVGMALASLDRRLIKVNDALCRMLNHPATDLIGRSLDELIRPEDVAELARLNLSMLAGETASYQSQPRLRHSSGHYLAVDLSVSIFRDNTGQPAYTITQVIERPVRTTAANGEPCPLRCESSMSSPTSRTATAPLRPQPPSHSQQIHRPYLRPPCHTQTRRSHSNASHCESRPRGLAQPRSPRGLGVSAGPAAAAGLPFEVRLASAAENRDH